MKLGGKSWLGICHFSLSDLKLSFLHKHFRNEQVAILIPSINTFTLLLVSWEKLEAWIHQRIRFICLANTLIGNATMILSVHLFEMARVCKRNVTGFLTRLALSGSANWTGSTWLLSKYQNYNLLNEINIHHNTTIMRVCSAAMIIECHCSQVWLMGLHRLSQDQMA